MSFTALFTRKSSSNESAQRSSKDNSTMLSRGREIVRGRLYMRKGSSSKKSLGEVIVYCAPRDCSQPGQLEIHEEVNKTYQKPKKVIPLTEINQPGVQSGSPCTSLSSSPGNPSAVASSPSSNGIPYWPFQIVLRTGEVLEFFTESPEDQRQWVKRLGLLLMFPYSPIPDEPVNSPIKDSFRAKLDPAQYRADSVWAVYILPEEVGPRVNALGLHVIALRSRGANNQPGQLDIISLADPSTPIVTWDRDKMRRTGCLGNMVFIEIGRRCHGGPGLVWMWAGPKETAALRETLHTFLFKGDGRAVPIATQHNNVRTDNGNNRVSFDSGLPPSYPKRSSSSSSYHQSPSINTPQRQQSIDSQASDSGLPPSFPSKRGSSSFQQSPGGVAMPQRQLSMDSQPNGDLGQPSSPYTNSQPPPVHLNSHPSRRHSFRSSNSSSMAYENVDMDSGISSNCTSSRRSSTMSDMNDVDQFQLEEDSSNDFSTRHTTFSSPKSTSHYQVPPIRSHTVSSPRPYHHPATGEYEKMINPRGMSVDLSQQQQHLPNGEEQYVQMKSAPNRTNSFRSLSDSPPKHLRPITEGHESSNYENLGFQSNVRQSDFEYYAPQYENMDQFTIKRHSSFSGREKHVKSASPSAHHNVRTVETPSPPVIIPTP